MAVLTGLAAGPTLAGPAQPSAADAAVPPTPLTFGITPVFLAGQSNFLDGFSADLVR